MNRDALPVPVEPGPVAASMQVHSYLACAPRDAGVSAALFYAPRGTDVLGWLAGGAGGRCVAAFFAVEDYFAKRGARFCRSVDDDIRGPWLEESAPVTTGIRCPIAEAECAGLSRLQSAFVREWLFVPDDPVEHDEVDAYRRLGYPLQPINVRTAQFDRFDRHRPTWVHASPGVDFNVVLYLKRRLPLDRRAAPVLT